MMTLLKSRFWIVRLLGWGCAVAFLTSATVTTMGAQLLIDDALVEKLPEEVQRQLTAMMSQSAKSRTGTESTEGSQTGSILLSHNLFCPTCKPVAETPEEEGEGEEEVEGPVSDELVPSELPYTLAATMEADDPRYSIAVLVESETRATRPLSPGDEVQDNVILERVERARVILRNGRQLEYIDANGTPPPKRSVRKKDEKEEPKRRVRRRSSREIEGAEEAINCKGDTCTVDKAFRDKIISNPALLAKQARVVPAVRDGETRGFKFYGIRNGSLPKLFGLNNGDLITSINGAELRSYDEVLGLYNKLRRANHITVGVERNGKQITKEVNFE